MITELMHQYLREIHIDQKDVLNPKSFPFYLEAIKSLKSLVLHPNVTFLIGENGTGKSTLLEAIAVAYGFNPEGGSKNFNFATKETHSNLHTYLKLIKGITLPKDGFFLRAESFYNVASNIDELEKDELSGSLLDSYGNLSLHEQSHGESFMALVMNRFRGKGIYLLDEPEAALSPSRQLALISRIHQLVMDNSQFIIATHSPILMAYPHAKIVDVSRGFEEIRYEDTDHYIVTKSFLNQPQKMLDILLKIE